jgi:hypothetical protein
MTKIIIGQECICPDGLGRVVKIINGPANTINIKVDTYVDNRSCEWSEHNVTLIPIFQQKDKITNPLKEAAENIEKTSNYKFSPSELFAFRQGWFAMGKYLVNKELINEERLPKIKEN